MGKLFNSINKGFSRIFRVLLFVLSAFLIIYFFPKSGKFKYNFENGRPWQSENLYAPFDFAIKKSKQEIDDEITQVKINTPLFFEIDTSLIENYIRSMGFISSMADKGSIGSTASWVIKNYDVLISKYPNKKDNKIFE